MADVFDQVAPDAATSDPFEAVTAQPPAPTDAFEAVAQQPSGDVFDQVAGGAPAPQAPQQAGFGERAVNFIAGLTDPAQMSTTIPAATRLGGAALSPVGGIPGAAAAASTETAAEIEERLFGTRSSLEPREIGAAGAVGALPFGRLGQALGATGTGARMAAGALEGATLGATSAGLEAELGRGEAPSGSELGFGALAGTVLGTAGGAFAREAPRTTGLTGQELQQEGMGPFRSFAIRTADGQVHEGTPKYGHAQIAATVEDAGHDLTGAEDGFVTKGGEFVNRDEARTILAAGEAPEGEAARVRRELAVGQSARSITLRQAKASLADATAQIGALPPEAQADLADRYFARSRPTQQTPEEAAIAAGGGTPPRFRPFTPEEEQLVGPLQKVAESAHADMVDAGLTPGKLPYYAPLLANDPAKVEAYLAGQGGEGTGLATGRLKRRGLTLQDVRAAGGGLITENLGELEMIAATQESKLAMQRRVLDAEIKAGRFTEEQRYGLGQVDPRITDALELPRLYGPNDAVNALNDELVQSRQAQGVQRVLGGLNAVRQFRVAFGLYHYFMEGFNLAGDGLGRALGELGEGRPLRAAATAGKTLVGRDAVEAYRLGKTVTHEANTVDLLAGNQSEDLQKAIKGGFNFDTEARLGRSLAQLMQEEGRTAGAELAGRGGELVESTLDKISKPLMQRFVPYVKIGTYLKNVQALEERLGRPASAAELYAEARHTDAIFGQMAAYNSPFSASTRRIIAAAIQFPGWNIGSFQLLTGAAKGALKTVAGSPLTQREAQASRFALGLAMASAIGGSMVQYAATGQAPQSLTDAFYPRTGRKNPDGTDERIQLQNYVRDAVALGKGVPSRVARGDIGAAIGQGAQNVLHIAQSKESLLITAPLELAANMDRAGRQIFTPEGGLAKNALEAGRYAAKQVVPFATQGLTATPGARPPVLGQAGQFAGFQRAPEFVSQSEAEAQASDILRQRAQERGPMSADDAQRSAERQQLRSALRSGDASGPDQLAAAVEKGTVTRHELRTFLIELGLPTIMAQVYGMGLEDALHVYRKANAKEREELAPLIAKKVAAAAKSGNVRALQAFGDSQAGF